MSRPKDCLCDLWSLGQHRFGCPVEAEETYPPCEVCGEEVHPNIPCEYVSDKTSMELQSIRFSLGLDPPPRPRPKSTTPRRFTVYRTGDLSASHDANQVNPADQPQFEGVVFTDGTVVVRWRTACPSTAVFADFESLWKIHGHADANSKHGTMIRWLDD